MGKIPWRRKWQPTPVFLPGESHGQRSLQAKVHGVTKRYIQLSKEHTLLHMETRVLEAQECQHLLQTGDWRVFRVKVGAEQSPSGYGLLSQAISCTSFTYLEEALHLPFH